MHLAIPPTPIRNPEKGFKAHPKKTRTESISAIETESAQPSSDGSSEKSFRSIIKECEDGGIWQTKHGL
ncbi:uncharacterized protein N7518_001915 [Penicillium psychrosexuale]|uniref:uncharacterized protein n=1 Tax=Penicillium psychrosexuale TaxID=1002107 RepID=UPI002545331D|nr:uncharacterized protein N7518_001915 [Penicillium psychrosexuale]KAJ5799847.1 hypothetical protein N7518_001915 [Penicillium psychrosexuale]